MTQHILDKDSKISSLIQQHIEILFRKNKYQVLIQHIFDKDSKIFSLI